MKVVVVEPMPAENLEALKILIMRVTLRKFQELENEATKGEASGTR